MTQYIELGENATATLHKGDVVIVVGRERTSSWGDKDNKRYRRVINAETIRPDLNRDYDGGE